MLRSRAPSRIRCSHLPWAGRIVVALLAVLAGIGNAPAQAQGFAAYISPPRFEVQLKAGQTQREVIEIQHVGLQSGRYRIYTNDWLYRPDGTVVFSDELAAGSCRPWVALETRELTISPNARYRFRFEISPPPDTSAGECRFAIMIEGLDPAKVTQGSLSLPVGGRVAVIVYAGVGDAEPRLEITATSVATVNGLQLPILVVRNLGNAHGRLDGFLQGKDAAGHEFEMAPSNAPILPGDTRPIELNLVAADGVKTPAIEYPLEVKGTLEWGKNSLPLEQRFAP